MTRIAKWLPTTDILFKVPLAIARGWPCFFLLFLWGFFILEDEVDESKELELVLELELEVELELELEVELELESSESRDLYFFDFPAPKKHHIMKSTFCVNWLSLLFFIFISILLLLLSAFTP